MSCIKFDGPMKKLVTFSFVLLFLFSCSTDRPSGDTEAQILFQEAEVLVKDDHYMQATEKLNTLRSKFPYSFYATHAELLQADILYLQESFTESAAAYILFRDFHPKHGKKSYVTWRIGQSFYNQLPDTVDRDLTAAKEAIKYFEEVINKYPSKE